MELKIYGDLPYFWQWDHNRKLIVEDGGVCSQVHYCNGSGEALVCLVRDENGQRVADVPNILLQKANPITAYLYTTAVDGSRTRRAYRFEVLPRSIPDDYVYTETDVLNYHSLVDRINQIEQNGVSDEQIANAVKAYLAENPAGVNFEADGTTLILKDGVLSVNTTNEMEQDNTQPITSAGVYATVGNIEALLKTI